MSNADSSLACYDVAAIGEVMMRLDPGWERIRRARSFDVAVSGAEMNVVAALTGTFGMRTALLSSLVSDEMGRSVESMLKATGVDATIRWVSPRGGSPRNPVNYTERGFGLRAPVSVSDRADSPARTLGHESWAVEDFLDATRPRLLHISGVFASLSSSTYELTERAFGTARARGIITSFDVNYRSQLWAERGGVDAARRMFSTLATEADWLFGDPRLPDPAHTVAGQERSFDGLVSWVATALPRTHAVASTIRVIRDASTHEWSGRLWMRSGVSSQGRVETPPNLIPAYVLDRVGSGDAFAAGVIHGLLHGDSPRVALGKGIALGALTLTTVSDVAAATLGEVDALATGAVPRIQR